MAESEELDNVETIVGFWAIDDSLEKIRGILKQIADICDVAEGKTNDVD